MPRPPAAVGVMSIMQASMGVAYGCGLMFIGSIGDASNLHVAFLAGSVLILLGFALLTWRSQRWRHAVDGTLAAPAAGPGVTA